MKFIQTIAIIILATVTITFAQKSDENCAIEAWVEDKELQKDIFIRENPSPLSKILGEIPYRIEENETEVIVEIIGYAKGEYTKGWLKIRKAATIEDKVLFQGIGWIPAKRVTANVQRPDGNSKKGATIFAQPKSTARKVGTVPSDELIKILGYHCFGLKVKYKKITGWLSAKNICGNSVTTCVR